MSLSEKIIGKAKSRWRKKVVRLSDGDDVEVRAPTRAQQSLAMREAGLRADKDGGHHTENSAAMVIRLLISCCYYPEGSDQAGQRVFSEVDKATLLDTPSGDPDIESLCAAALELMNTSEEAGKN
jgi:hypothetical protein